MNYAQQGIEQSFHQHLSHFINRYEQRIIVYIWYRRGCKYFYELQSINFARRSDDMANKLISYTEFVLKPFFKEEDWEGTFHRSRIELPLGLLLKYSRSILLYMEVKYNSSLCQDTRGYGHVINGLLLISPEQLVVRRLCCYYYLMTEVVTIVDDDVA